MNDYALTNEERNCLQRWFRQAIAKVEQDEVTAQFIKSHGTCEPDSHSRTPVVRRRTRRNKVFSHMRQLVAQ